MRLAELTDVALIPTSKVTATLSSELGDFPLAKGFVISGYPRNMRDVADYLEKVRRRNTFKDGSFLFGIL